MDTEQKLLKSMPGKHVNELTTAVNSLLSEVPEKEHRLTEFAPEEPDNVPQWSGLASQISDMQSKIKKELSELHEKDEDVLAMINVDNLAQSVLI